MYQVAQAEIVISIHAPTNGATNKSRRLRQKKIFQSTLRRTERQRYAFIRLRDRHFNPRSDERSDAKQIMECVKAKVISIHAPTNGATSDFFGQQFFFFNFNPRSDERSDND